MPNPSIANSHVLLLVAAAACLTAPAFAADGGADAGSGPAADIILVTASRDDTFAIGGSVHRLDAADLAVFSYSDINRVLRLIPGVLVQEEEGFGLRPNIGIRGSGSDRSARVAIMEDGVLVAPAAYAAPAAYYFPRMARISSVEVAKGPAAIKYGPQTIGGAVSFLSTPIPETDGLFGLGGHADLLGGSFGAVRAHGNLGGWFSAGGNLEIGALVEGVHERSSGFKRLDSPAGADTGFAISDMVLKLGLRSKDGVHDLQLKFQRYDETSDETYLGLTQADFAADPFRRYAASQLDEMTVRQDFWQASYRFAPSERFELAATAYHRRVQRAWYKLNDVRNSANTGWQSLTSILENPEPYSTKLNELRGTDGFSGRTGSLRVRNNNRAYESTGAQLLAATRFDTGPASHRLEASVRYHQDSEDRFQQDDLYTNVNGMLQLASAGAPGSQDNRLGEAKAWAFFVRDTIEAGRLTLTPGLRFETIDLVQTRWALTDPERTTPISVSSSKVDVWIPGIGATFDLGSDFRLVAGAHRGFSNPAPGSTARAETSWNYEAGVRFGSPRSGIEAIGFLNAYDNLVGTCTASTGGECDIGDQFDGGRARAAGVEIVANHQLAGIESFGFALPVSLAYTFLETEFQTSFNSGFGPWGTVVRGDEFPYSPKHQLTLGLGLALDSFTLDALMNWTSAARARAGQGSIAASQRIDDRVVIDLSTSYTLRPGLRLFGSVTNVTDQVFNVALSPSGFRPGMPRAFIGGVKANF